MLSLYNKSLTSTKNFFVLFTNYNNNYLIYFFKKANTTNYFLKKNMKIKIIRISTGNINPETSPINFFDLVRSLDSIHFNGNSWLTSKTALNYRQKGIFGADSYSIVNSYLFGRPDFEAGLDGHPNVDHELFPLDSIHFYGNSWLTLKTALNYRQKGIFGADSYSIVNSYLLGRPDFEAGLDGHPNVDHELSPHDSIRFYGNSWLTSKTA